MPTTVTLNCYMRNGHSFCYGRLPGQPRIPGEAAEVEMTAIAAKQLRQDRRVIIVGETDDESLRQLRLANEDKWRNAGTPAPVSVLDVPKPKPESKPKPKSKREKKPKRTVD